MATGSRILAWENDMDKGAWQATVHGAARSQTQLTEQNRLKDTGSKLAVATEEGGGANRGTEFREMNCYVQNIST